MINTIIRNVEHQLSSKLVQPFAILTSHYNGDLLIKITRNDGSYTQTITDIEKKLHYGMSSHDIVHITLTNYRKHILRKYIKVNPMYVKF